MLHRLFVGTLAFAGAGLAFVGACGGDEHPPPPQPRVCIPPPRPANASAKLASSAPFGDRTFAQPIEIVSGPGGRFYVNEQAGVVRVVPPDGGPTTTAIDLSARVTSGGEAGLLGIAFDPAFAQNGFVYLHFDEKITAKPNVVFQSVIARFTSSDDVGGGDPGSSRSIRRPATSGAVTSDRTGSRRSTASSSAATTDGACARASTAIRLARSARPRDSSSRSWSTVATAA